MEKFCGKCGYTNSTANNYCNHCGSKFEGTESNEIKENSNDLNIGDNENEELLNTDTHKEAQIITKNNYWIYIIIGLVLIIGVYKGCFENTTHRKPEYYSPNKYDSTSAKKADDEVRVGNFVYRVNGIGWYHELGNNFNLTKADGIFLIVELSLKNLDDREHTLDNSYFYLTDKNGIHYESSDDGTEAMEINGDRTLFLKQCNPNIQKRGFLCFEVPTKSIYTLHLTGGGSSGQWATVSLSN